MQARLRKPHLHTMSHIHTYMYMLTNVPSKLRGRARAPLFVLARTTIFSRRTIGYVRHRSRMLLLTRQANARTAKIN